MNYSLIIPIYNERRTVTQLINKLYRLDRNNIEIIIIDDGSNDGTKEILNKNTDFIIGSNKVNMGKGAAVIKGFELASKENIILMDGDLEIDIDDLPNIILEYEKDQTDVLTGVRWGIQSKKRIHNINRIGNLIINSIFNFLYKTNFKDVLCCVKILSSKNFKSLNIRSQRFSIEVETMAKLVLNKSKIKEVYVQYKRRTNEEGKKLKLSDSWAILKTMIEINYKNNKKL